MLGKRGSKEASQRSAASGTSTGRHRNAKHRNGAKQTGPLLGEAGRGGSAVSDRGQVLNYQNCLRAIGRYLDMQECRYMVVSETLEGFVVRAFPQGTTNLQFAEAIVFTADDLATMVSQFRAGQARAVDAMKVPPLLPTGYEDFLRAVGFECDATGMLDVRIVEMINGVALTYSDRNNKEHQQIAYTARQIHDLLNKAFHRRGSGKAATVAATTNQDVPAASAPGNGQHADPASLSTKSAVPDIFGTETLTPLSPPTPRTVLKRIQH